METATAALDEKLPKVAAAAVRWSIHGTGRGLPPEDAVRRPRGDARADAAIAAAVPPASLELARRLRTVAMYASFAVALVDGLVGGGGGGAAAGAAGAGRRRAAQRAALGDFDFADAPAPAGAAPAGAAPAGAARAEAARAGAAPAGAARAGAAPAGAARAEAAPVAAARALALREEGEEVRAIAPLLRTTVFSSDAP
jgi:hypothetical protein